MRENVADRPWLNHAQYVGANTCRVLAAVDKGGGHFLERHGSTITPEMTEARAKRMEDPAITDETARTPGKDRFKSGRHMCGDVAAIRDPNQIPDGDLGKAAQYDDGSPEKFLARLWHDLYPDEPLPTA